MKPDGAIKLASELLDLPLLDSEGTYCGIVDDVELTGQPGKPLKLAAILVGPGAYEGRLPSWAMWLVRRTVGKRVTRVPFERVRTIGAAVKLSEEAKTLGLQKSEDRFRRWIPRKWAL